MKLTNFPDYVKQKWARREAMLNFDPVENLSNVRCDKCKHFRRCEVCIGKEIYMFNICDMLLNDPEGYALVVYADDKCEMFTEENT